MDIVSGKNVGRGECALVSSLGSLFCAQYLLQIAVFIFVLAVVLTITQP